MRPRPSRRSAAPSLFGLGFVALACAALVGACSEGGTGTGTAPPPAPGCPSPDKRPVAGTPCTALEVCHYDGSNTVALCPGGKGATWQVSERGDAIVADVSGLDAAGDADDAVDADAVGADADDAADADDMGSDAGEQNDIGGDANVTADVADSG